MRKNNGLFFYPGAGLFEHQSFSDSPPVLSPGLSGLWQTSLVLTGLSGHAQSVLFPPLYFFFHVL